MEFIVLLLAFGVVSWAWSGLKKLPIGSRGLLLFLGKRQSSEVGEGWHWVPWPYGVIGIDCRQAAIGLSDLEVITKDNVHVRISGSVIREVTNINEYLGVDENTIKQGLDDIWYQIIRNRVVELDLNDVLRMKFELEGQTKNGLNNDADTNWGIKVVRVNIAGIRFDQSVTEDLQLKKRKELQLEGRMVDTQYFSNQVQRLMLSPPLGPGLTREQAIEQLQLFLGQQKKLTFALDPSTAALVAAILEGRK